jgi:hypothetical protein
MWAIPVTGLRLAQQPSFGEREKPAGAVRSPGSLTHLAPLRRLIRDNLTGRDLGWIREQGL